MPSGSRGGAKSGQASPAARLDDTAELQLERRQRFDAWKKGYRRKSLDSSGKGMAFKYENSPKPPKANSSM